MNLTAAKIHAVKDLIIVTKILYACGKDMAMKYDIHHWDNPWIKTFVIVLRCLVKNQIYVVGDQKIVATYQTKKNGDALYFEKLAVMPEVNGKGIGSFCLKQIEAEARNTGCAKVQMDVYSKSQHAIQFYLNLGYTQVGVDKTLKYEVVCLEKVL